MNQNQSSDSVAFLGVACLFILGWAFWHFFHQQVTDLFKVIRHGELWLIGLFVHNTYVARWEQFLGNRNQHVDWGNITSASKLIGYYFRYPVAAIFAVMTWFALFHSPRASLKTVFSLDRLILAQSKVWPVISPVVKFNAAEANARDPNARQPIPVDLPVFAEALTPEEWLRWHRIAPYDTLEHERTTDPLDHQAAFQAFAEQLGPRWRGPHALPWHLRGLFAAFALKAARKRDEADDLLGELAMAADPKKGMNLKLGKALQKKIMRVIADPKVGGEATKIANQHAYVAPALMKLLAYARERGGVLAPAQFLWLRGAQRALWYPLNNVGRQSFHTEAAGAMAHFQAEIVSRTPLLSPKVDKAVETVEAHTRHKERGLVPGLAE